MNKESNKKLKIWKVIIYKLQLRYAFTVLVPLNEDMKGTLIVDVGSRLGAVLYAVYSYRFVLVVMKVFLMSNKTFMKGLRDFNFIIFSVLPISF